MLDDYMQRKKHGRVICNTGTPGSRPEIHHVYQSRNFQLFSYPSHETSQRVIRPMKYVKTKEEQKQEILKLLRESANRPVVIQCPDMNAVKFWEQALAEFASLPGRKLHTLTAKNLSEKDSIIAETQQNGSILISNICGRGVDITPVSKDPGLLAIETGIQTFRGTWQFYGRGGRNGVKGEAISIYCDEDTVERFGVSLLSRGDLARAIAELQSRISDGITQDKFLIDMKVGIEAYVQKQVQKCSELAVAKGVAREQLVSFQVQVTKQLMDAWVEIDNSIKPGSLFEGEACPLYPQAEAYYRVGEFFQQAEAILAKVKSDILSMRGDPQTTKLTQHDEQIISSREKRLQDRTLKHKYNRDDRPDYSAPTMLVQGTTPSVENSPTIRTYNHRVQRLTNNRKKIKGVERLNLQLLVDSKEPQRVGELNAYKQKEENAERLFSVARLQIRKSISCYLTAPWIATDRKELARALKSTVMMKSTCQELLRELNSNLVKSLHEDLFGGHWFRSTDSRFRSMLWQSKTSVVALCSVQQLNDVIGEELSALHQLLKEELLRPYYADNLELKSLVQKLRNIAAGENPKDRIVDCLPLLQSILKHPQYDSDKHSRFEEINKYCIRLAEGLYPDFDHKQRKTFETYANISHLLKSLKIDKPSRSCGFFGNRDYSLPVKLLFKDVIDKLPSEREKYYVCQLLTKVKNCLAKTSGVADIKASIDLADKSLIKLEFSLPIKDYETQPYIMAIKVDIENNKYFVSQCNPKPEPAVEIALRPSNGR